MTTIARAALGAALLLTATAARSSTHVDVGTSVDSVELRTVNGTKEKLLSSKARANVVVFFRTGQERSVDALVQLAACEKLFAGKPVRWVGVVSDSEAPAAVLSLTARTGVAMPVVIDEGDVVYGKLGIRIHPMLAFVDDHFKLTAFEMYRQIDYCEIVKARIRLMLGEIDQAAFELVVNPARSSMPGDDPRDVARRDVNLGRMLLKRKALDKAAASAQKALERAPIAAANALMGDVWQARGDCAKAREQYDQALRLDPKDASALAGKAACAGK